MNARAASGWPARIKGYAYSVIDLATVHHLPDVEMMLSLMAVLAAEVLALRKGTK